MWPGGELRVLLPVAATSWAPAIHSATSPPAGKRFLRKVHLMEQSLVVPIAMINEAVVDVGHDTEDKQIPEAAAICDCTAMSS